MITNFYIITEGGTLLFHRRWAEQNNGADPSLLSGFISAISQFADAIGEGTIKSMNIARHKWSYLHGPRNIIGIAISDKIDDDDLIKEHFLEPMLEKFADHYGTSIDDHQGDVDAFKNFNKHVDEQLEIYKQKAAEQTRIISTTQALTINGAIELFGRDNLALMIRHATNYRLVLVGDEVLGKKIAALLQSLAPIHLTTEINEYTDLYITSEMPDVSEFESDGVKYAIFKLPNQEWMDYRYKKAEFEKDLIKEVLRKQFYLSDMDQIMLFRKMYLEVMDRMTDYISVIKKYEKHKRLEKELQKVFKDKDKDVFMHGYIKKSVGLDVKDYFK